MRVLPPLSASEANIPVQVQADTAVMTGITVLRKDVIPRESAGSDWIILPFLVSLLLITISRAAFRRRFRYIFLSLFSTNNMNIMLREGNILSEPVSVLLFGNYIIMMSMFFFLLPGILPSFIAPDLPSFLWLPIILVVLILFIALKVTAITLSGNIFMTGEESSAYLLNMFLFNHVAGIIIWPVLLASVYTGSKELLMIGAIALAVLYLVRGIKGMIIGLRRSRFSPVLFLLYLCTLEIIPLLLLVKLSQEF